MKTTQTWEDQIRSNLIASDQTRIHIARVAIENALIVAQSTRKLSDVEEALGVIEEILQDANGRLR